MKKTFLFLCILLAAINFNSFAQSAVATLGTIVPNTFVSGVPTPVLTTSDRITRSVGLNISTPGYTVTSYKCTIVAGSSTWGPVSVTGGLLTDEIITHVKATRGPNVNVVFSNIHAAHGSTDVTMPVIALKYDQ
jgi:hypothetical protein